MAMLTIAVEGEYVIRLNQIKAEMKKVAEDNSGDYEGTHIHADNLLKEALEILGFQDLVEDYDKVGKWYA